MTIAVADVMDRDITTDGGTPIRKTVKLSEIVFDQKVYPRAEHSPKLVQRYSECLAEIEAHGHFMCVDARMRLIDGRHRHLAYQTVYHDEPDHEVVVWAYPVSADDEVFDLAAQLNSAHGAQMSEDDKCRAARMMYGWASRRSQEAIARTLSVSTAKVNGWLAAILENERKEREETMWSMWLACGDAPEIADAVGLKDRTVREFLQKTADDFCRKEPAIFRNFEPQVYTVWSFAKATNEVRHFGNIPPEVVDNLLYYYTKPFDVVFDPFGGGGMTVDVCKQRLRRYYVSDLTPIPARQGQIRQWDIAQGLPSDLPVPDLVFLDPPYWKQAEGRYSDKPTDLANIELEQFTSAIGEIAKSVKRKWNGARPDGRLALIIGPYKHNGEYIDLPFLCYQAIAKYLRPVIRIQVPYSTQVHGGNYVKMAKEAKELLYLSRDLMVFGA